MKLEKRKPTGREKDQEAIELLEQLREKLYSDNSSIARRSAFNLAWMQEDGLEILAEALLKSPSRRTKCAACYGLRRMHGRMKKLGRMVLDEGTKSNDIEIRTACQRAVDLLEHGPPKHKPHRGSRSKVRIKEYRHKKRGRRISHTSPREDRSNGNQRNNGNRRYNRR